MFFKCKHPARWLGVKKQETVEKKSADFDVVTYHLRCCKCGEDVALSYAKMIGGVDAFLKRGGAPVDA
jgi:hypothetical protein